MKVQETREKERVMIAKKQVQGLYKGLGGTVAAVTSTVAVDSGIQGSGAS